MIYLASPYSHPDPAVEWQRYDAACRATAHFINRGFPVFSPIAHSHVLHVTYGCGGDWQTWRQLDEDLIKASSAVWVLMVDGWRESRGIAAEIAYAESLFIPVTFVEVPDGN
jgi:hypothetical protein